MAGGRVPPHSAEAEQSLIGGLLLDNRALDRLPAISAADFYSGAHQIIWQSVVDLLAAGRPADVTTVGAALEASQRLEQAGGQEYLHALSACVPSASNAPAYAGIVVERSVRRALIATAAAVQDAAYRAASDDAAASIIDRAVTDLLRLQDGRRNDEPQDLAPLAVKFIDDLQARADGQTDAIGTGLTALDRLTADGGRRGELWVIGARPSMGKTAFVLSLCREVGRRHRVLMMTQEDSLMSLTARHVAAAGRVNLAHLRSPANAPHSMWEGVTEGVQVLQPLQVTMDDQAALKLSDVRRKIQQVKRRHGDVAMVVIDYLQLMDGELDNRNQALGLIANGLKRAAKELGCWIVLLSQLNREADKRTGLPQMSDLRDSGDIEGAADLIGLLHREWMRKPKPENEHLAELHVCKNKNGRTGTLKFFFDGAVQRFGNWEDEAESEGAY